MPIRVLLMSVCVVIVTAGYSIGLALSQYAEKTVPEFSQLHSCVYALHELCSPVPTATLGGVTTEIVSS